MALSLPSVAGIEFCERGTLARRSIGGRMSTVSTVAEYYPSRSPADRIVLAPIPLAVGLSYQINFNAIWPIRRSRADVTLPKVEVPKTVPTAP